MRFKNLEGLRRQQPREIAFSTLPGEILIARYAREKAFKINELVLKVHGGSFEWYGFTIANRDHPELILDIGLPRNDENVDHYTRIDPEMIAEFQQGLPPESIINGWIHSHGALDLVHFSATDNENNRAVLDYVTTLMRKVLAKREIVVEDLSLLVEGRYSEGELTRGSVTLITDTQVRDARIFEAVYGGFSYAIVIGDGGWHEQEIHYKRRAILSGETETSMKRADLVLVETGAALTPAEIETLEGEVKEKIQPVRYSLIKLESM